MLEEDLPTFPSSLISKLDIFIFQDLDKRLKSSAYELRVFFNPKVIDCKTVTSSKLLV